MSADTINFDAIALILVKPDGLLGDELWVQFGSSPQKWRQLHDADKEAILAWLAQDNERTFEPSATWSWHSHAPPFPSSVPVNLVQLVGYVVGPPQLRYSPQGKGICDFLVSTSESSAPAEQPDLLQGGPWHRIIAEGDLGVVCNQLLSIGALVQIEGHLRSSWRLVDIERDEEQYSTDILADNIMIREGVIAWRRRLTA